MKTTDTPQAILGESSLYEGDFALWLERQAKLLRERRFDELDVENLVEEVEDIGRSRRRAVESNLRITLIHLLKYQFQPAKRTKSWLDSLLEHRDRLARDFRDSPSLRRYAQEELAEAYRVARKRASAQTRLSLEIFPEHCPYSFEQVLDEDFLPE
jgi:hypothetical protein